MNKEYIWFPYPKNIPKNSGTYLVTRKGDSEIYVDFGKYDCFRKQHDKDGNKFYGPVWMDVCDDSFHLHNVIAFCFLPDAYEEKINE